MNDIQAKHVIQSMYNQILSPGRGLLNRFAYDDANLAMYFPLRIDYDNHGFSQNGEQNTPYKDEWQARYSRFLHFIVTARHRCYGVISEEWDLNDIGYDEFRNLSNHDSEWRSGLDLIDQALNEGWEHIMKPLPPEHKARNRYYPQPFTAFGLGLGFGNTLNFVRVKREPIADPKLSNSGYFDRLVDIKPVQFSINIEG